MRRFNLHRPLLSLSFLLLSFLYAEATDLIPDMDLVSEIEQDFLALRLPLEIDYSFRRDEVEGGMWARPSFSLMIELRGGARELLDKYSRKKEFIYALWPYLSSDGHQFNAGSLIMSFTTPCRRYIFDRPPDISTLGKSKLNDDLVNKIKAAAISIVKGRIGSYHFGESSYDTALLDSNNGDGNMQNSGKNLGIFKVFVFSAGGILAAIIIFMIVRTRLSQD